MNSAGAKDPELGDGQEAWITAYAGWYYHFLAMQPKEDRLAVDWAHRMTEAVLLELPKRPDRAEIRSLASQRRPVARQAQPKPVAVPASEPKAAPEPITETEKPSADQMPLF